MAKSRYSCWICNLGLTFSLAIGGVINSTGVALFNNSPRNSAFAQIVPDQTLGTESSVINPNVNIEGTLSDQIEGGAIRGTNLFHSFEEFNVREGQGAYFINPVGIEHILSRVTGNSVSQILGKLGVLGNADLFLINSNGIVFGPNATLDLKGSFLATTANSLIFEDGTQFSATDTDTSAPPLLTVSIPASLQFRETAGSIFNQSQVLSPTSGLGLEVQPGKTLALVGGNITMQGGSIAAPSGRIELGSVAGTGQVRLRKIDSGWALSYKGVQNFQDIKLTQSPTSNNRPLFGISLLSTISFDDSGGGSVQLQGRRVNITNGSQIAGIGADIVVSASETVHVSGSALDIFSAIGSVSPLTGKGGSVTINTNKLIVQDGGVITSDTSGFESEKGQLTTTTVSGGDLIVNAFESVELKGNTETGLFSSTSSFGAAGNITINTRKLTVRDGAIISAETSGLDESKFPMPIATGTAGDININTSESLELNSGSISTETRGLGGDAGNLTIATGQMNIIGGGRVLASTTGQGKGGNIFVDASDFVNISGFDNDGTTSGLFAQSDDIGTAGNVTINTPQLRVHSGAEVTVSSPQGQAGNLTIDANSLSLNQGSITAETGKSAGEGGANITFKISDLFRIENESLISAKAFEIADGGNIDVDTKFMIAFPSKGLEGSDIIASADQGDGGNINITTEGIFGIEEGKALEGNQTNDIDASSEFGLAGVVEINQPDIDPNRGLVELPETVVDPNTLVNQNSCKQGSESEFVITGRGGLPPSLNEDLSSDATQVGLVEPAPMESRRAEDKPSSTSSVPKPIIPAQGWVFNEQGEVVLVAYDPTITGSQRLKKNPAGCPMP